MAQADWSYFPAAVPNLWDVVYPMLAARVQVYAVQARNQGIYPSHRASCVFRKAQLGNIARSSLFSYDNIPNYDYAEAGVIGEIGQYLATQLRPLFPASNFDFDHVLCHIYRDGSDHLGYHRDKESMSNCVVSLSIGAAREFRFRAAGTTSGYSHSYMLGDGDVLCMHEMCQQNWLHSIPATAQPVGPRINLTYRITS